MFFAILRSVFFIRGPIRGLPDFMLRQIEAKIKSAIQKHCFSNSKVANHVKSMAKSPNLNMKQMFSPKNTF